MPTLENLLEEAAVIEKNIGEAIIENDNESVDSLSAQFETVVSNILSFPIKSFADLKHKVSFSLGLILPEHNDSEMVKHVFSQLIEDIESLDAIHTS